jgi:hypothetical protein
VQAAYVLPLRRRVVHAGLVAEAAAAGRSGGAPSHPPPYDFLGELIMELELSSHWKSQFFTPYTLCELMARMTADTEHL